MILNDEYEVTTIKIKERTPSLSEETPSSFFFYNKDCMEAFSFLDRELYFTIRTIEQSALRPFFKGYIFSHKGSGFHKILTYNEIFLIGILKAMTIAGYTLVKACDVLPSTIENAEGDLSEFVNERTTITLPRFYCVNDVNDVNCVSDVTLKSQTPPQIQKPPLTITIDLRVIRKLIDLQIEKRLNNEPLNNKRKNIMSESESESSPTGDKGMEKALNCTSDCVDCLIEGQQSEHKPVAKVNKVNKEITKKAVVTQKKGTKMEAKKTVKKVATKKAAAKKTTNKVVAKKTPAKKSK